MAPRTVRLLIAFIVFTSWTPSAFAQDTTVVEESTAEADTNQPIENTTDEDAKITDLKLAAWLQEDPVDIEDGLIMAALGIVGALVVAFPIVGGVFPGTLGKVELDKAKEQLLKHNQRLEEALNAKKKDPQLILAVNEIVNDLRDDIEKATRWQFRIGAAMYTVLGALAAAFLAADVVQALVFGAGSVGILGSFGLKNKLSDDTKVKNDAIEKLMDRVAALEMETEPQDQTSPHSRAVIQEGYSAMAL